MAVTIEIEYAGALHTEATHGPSGDRLRTDAPVDNGGKGEAFSPTDLLATALGSCILTVVGLVAERDGLDVSGLRATVQKEMVSQPTRRVGHLHVTIRWPEAARLSDDQKVKLVRAGRQCPVCQSLSPEIQVEIDWGT